MSVGFTNVGDAGLKSLKELPQLRVLHLDFTKVSDAGLKHLKELPQLRVLRLDFTKVSDAGLEHLKGSLSSRTSTCTAPRSPTRA